MEQDCARRNKRMKPQHSRTTAHLIEEPMLRAQSTHTLLRLAQVVSGKRGEEVVLNLAVKAASEVVVEQASVDVPRRRQLGPHKVALVAEHLHPVMTLDEDEPQHGAAEELGGKNEDTRLIPSQTRQRDSAWQSAHLDGREQRESGAAQPEVVQREGANLEDPLSQGQVFHGERKEEALDAPTHACEEEDWEDQPVLDLHQAALLRCHRL